MSIFSYHLVKTSLVDVLRAILLPPNQKNTPGLVHMECMTVMTLGSALYSKNRFLFKELAVFAQWQNEESLDRFMKNEKFGHVLSKGWHTRLLFLRKWGNFSDFSIPNSNPKANNADNQPVVAVTIARLKFTQVPRFIHWGKPVEKLVRDHPKKTLALASIRLPNTVSTFSIWQTQKDMTDMTHGNSSVPQPKRHLDAMKERERKDFHFEFTTLRFLPISEAGSWKGKSNYIPKNQTNC